MSQNLTVRLARITGTPDKTHWSQTHTFFPEEDEKQKKRGVLLASLSFSGPEDGVEMVAMGREILSRLQEEFYGQLDDSTFERLAMAVEKVCQEFSQDEQKLEIVAGSLLGEVLSLASRGGGQVWIKREGVFQKVLEGSQDIERASGFLKAGDLIILGTAFFFEGLTQGVLKAALETDDPQEAVETLAPLVGGKEGSSKIAAVIGRVEKEEVVEEVGPAEEEELPPQEKIPLKRKFSDSFSQGFSKVKKLFPQRVYLRTPETSLEEQKKKRVVFTIAVLLIILLGISLFFGTKKRASKERKEEYERLYQEVILLLENGQGLVELNPTLARQQLSQAQEKISELERLAIEEEKTGSLRAQVEGALRLVVKEKEIGEAAVFFDLGILASEAKGDRLSLSGGYLFVLDKEKNRLFAIETTKKSGKILAGGEDLAGAYLVASYADLGYVLTSEGIYQVGVEGKKGKIVVEKDEAWGEIKALASYAGNLYLLDKTGKIWRYQRTDEGFGSSKNWFSEDVSPDFSKACCLAIDGSIWVLSQEGKILKFTLGALDVFGMAGLEKGFENPTTLYTDSEIDNLYILDKGNGRVVVLAKSGEYQFQYLWEGARQAQDMVVSEEEGKIFILAGEKVYEIGLE